LVHSPIVVELVRLWHFELAKFTLNLVRICWYDLC